MNVHLTDVSIEMSAAQTRAAKIVANRRALALMLLHHGDRQLERGCSSEARRIRRELSVAAGRPTALRVVSSEAMPASPAVDPDAAVRLMVRKARPAILALVDAVAAEYSVPVSLMLAPPRRAAMDSAEFRAQRANHAVMYRTYHEACSSFRALGLHFGKHPTSIRAAARHHARRLAAGEGQG